MYNSCTILQSEEQMNTYEFIASTLKTLVWPIFALLIFYQLKIPLRELLGRIKNVDSPWFKMELELKQISENLAETEIVKGDSNELHSTIDVKPKPILTIPKEYKNDNRKKVMIAWKQLSQQCMEISRQLNPESNSFDYSLQTLIKNEIIDISVLNAINHLQEIYRTAKYSTDAIPDSIAANYIRNIASMIFLVKASFEKNQKSPSN
jgi:hypothetical protein